MGVLQVWFGADFTVLGSGVAGGSGDDDGVGTGEWCRRLLATNEFAQFLIEDSRALADAAVLGLVPLPAALQVRVSACSARTPLCASQHLSFASPLSTNANRTSPPRRLHASRYPRPLCR